MARLSKYHRCVTCALSSVALLVVLNGCASMSRAPDDQPRSSRNTIVKADIDASSATRVEDLLIGRLPGVEVIRQVDGTPSVRVRGPSRLRGQVEPLYVIDGTITGPGSLFSLSPSNIESIRVLKGAEAALYGHRAGDAVLVVVTDSAGSTSPITEP